MDRRLESPKLELRSKKPSSSLSSSPSRAAVCRADARAAVLSAAGQPLNPEDMAYGHILLTASHSDRYAPPSGGTHGGAVNIQHISLDI